MQIKTETESMVHYVIDVGCDLLNYDKYYIVIYTHFTEASQFTKTIPRLTIKD